LPFVLAMPPAPIRMSSPTFAVFAGPARAATLALAVISCLAAGCARTAEERQLADMSAEIDQLQQSRDRADREELPTAAAESQTGTLPAPVLPALPPSPVSKAEPADQDAITLGAPASFRAQSSDSDDEYADTEDPSPRPVIRVFGSARGNGRSWRGEDATEPSGGDAADSRRDQGTTLDPAAPVAYDAAIALVNAKRYDRALDAFAAFLVRWPDHPYADNAMYWRGESYYALGDYRRASEQFEGVLARFPAGSKAPDALLKLGMSHLKLGDPTAAKASFDRLTELYPQSDAARRIPTVTVSSATPRGPASEDHR
jgi:tol-pal system protein YbgF